MRQQQVFRILQLLMTSTVLLSYLVYNSILDLRTWATLLLTSLLLLHILRQACTGLKHEPWERYHLSGPEKTTRRKYGKALMYLVLSSVLIMYTSFVLVYHLNPDYPKELAPCSSIMDEGERNKCLMDAILDIEDPLLCEHMGEDRNLCYKGVAVDSINLGTCNLITDPAERDKCKKSVASRTGG